MRPSTSVRTPLPVTAVALSALLCIAGCDIFQVDRAVTVDVDTEIRAEMYALGIPSVTACIVRGDSIVWKQAWGLADVQGNVPASTTTIYPLMSVSKLVIASAVMQLWEQGLLDLDTDVGDYLPFPVRNPSFPEHPITARMLMTHTSGLAHPGNEVPGWYNMVPDDQTPLMAEGIEEWILVGGAHYVPAAWKAWRPGERHQYSNIGTTILAYLVEIISGEEYTQYCVDHIFGPLGMDSTRFWLSELDAGNLATPYVSRNQAIPHYNTVAYPVGWLRSSVEDFSRFLMAIMNGGVLDGVRILNQSTIDTMLQTQNPANGLCLLWKRWLGEWIGHDGGGTGFATRLEINTGEKIGFLIMANLQTDAVHPGGRIYELIRYQVEQYR